MNRIYQGKVSKIELLDSKGATEEELGLEVLGEHHQLFQDAVNYYLMALAALASNPESPMGKMRQRMSEASSWEQFSRGERNFDGLRNSLIRSGVLGTNHQASFEQGLKAVLAGNSASPEIFQLAVDLLLSKVGGDKAIQQGGRGYWPRFCATRTNPTWDYTPRSMESGAGKAKLATLVHSPLDEVKRRDLAQEMDLSWTVKIEPSGKLYEGKDARDRLKTAVDHFATALVNSDTRVADFIVQFPTAINELGRIRRSIDAMTEISFPRNRKAAPALVFSSLLFQFFPSEVTQGLLALHIAKPKLTKSPADHPDPFAALGDDPIKLARGERGYVFPAFTSLPIFGAKGPDDIKWREFDIAAFKEALKTVNQFRLKTTEREERRQKFLNAIRYMDGQKVPWVDPEGGEESEAPARMKGDLRFPLAKQLIKDLRKNLELTDADNDSTTVSKRRLRGWGQLVAKFNQVVAPGEAFSEPKRQKLKEVLSKFQQEHVDDVGDIRLFEELISNGQYWCFWQEPTAAERARREENDWAGVRFLDQFRVYHEYLEETEWLKEPIRFTPADAQESRRLFMFSDLTGRSAIKHRCDVMAVEVSVAIQVDSHQWRERRVLLHYSAPRLRRDQLRKVDGIDDLSAAPWIQPMMEALGLEKPTTQDVTGHAVALMPEPGRQGMRYLLNLPVNLEPRDLIDALGKQSVWKSQFNGTREKHIHLHWPSTMDPKYQGNAWWKRVESFTCLAADLGTRACASVAVMRFLPGDPSDNENWIGAAEGRRWKSSLIDRKCLRLPGEDVHVRQNGEMREEPFGSRGRFADPQETAEFKVWLDVFGIPADHFWRERADSFSFPEQNDCMMRMFRRGQGRNMQLNRWLRFLNETDEERRNQALKEVGEEPNEQWKVWAKAPANLPALQEGLRIEIVKHQDRLKRYVVTLANRVLPLRGRRWEWVLREDRSNWVLQQTEPGSDDAKRKIRGQRGMSVLRIQQIEEFRRRLQSLNRALQREPGAKAKMGRPSKGMEIPDPCPDIAAKLDALKEQRTNQTAHLILAEALGVRLKEHTSSRNERKVRDIHGEYEPIPGRKPVDFIVLEDLTRYRTSQDRGPLENSRLMQWCHRAVTEKLKQLCEPYGIPVLEIPAAYTSKFCSRTGFAGFRAREIKPGEEFRMGKKQQRSREFADLQKMLNELIENGLSDHPLIVPARGGPRFVAMRDISLDEPEELSDDADLNAACNLALRAVAAPDAHHLLPRLRCRNEGGVLTFVGSIKALKPSKRDAARFEKAMKFEVTFSNEMGSDDDEEHSRKVSNIFVDLGRIADFEILTASGWDVPLATGKGLWGTVKRKEFAYCIKLNAARLTKWRGEGKMPPEDDIPM